MIGPGRLARLVQRDQAGEARALEDQIAADADGGATEALAALASDAVRAWTSKQGTRQAIADTLTALEVFLADLRRRITKTLAGLGDRATSALRRGLDAAKSLGIKHALGFAAKAANRKPWQVAAATPRDAADAIATLAKDVTRQIHTALGLLAPAVVRRLGGLPGVLTGIGAAKRATTMVRNRVAWTVQRVINAASQAAAQALGLGLLWIAEPDACPTCRAYSGRYAAPGEDFPGGISLDPKQRAYFPDPLPGPPRHPNCRCKVVPWSPAWGKALPRQLAATARAAD